MNDPGGMLATVEDSPQQWAHATDLVAAVPAFAVPDGARAVLVAGMGGSGIAADVARVLAEQAGTVPVVPVKDYRLPVWAGPATPLVAVSYSGDTEETLAAVDAAQAAGCPWLAVTSGGALAAQAEATGTPLVRLPGGRQPRASLAYLTVPVLVALARGGVLPALEPVGVPEWLAKVRAAWGDTPAEVATALVGHVPVFLGGTGLGGLVALRARCQVNENAEVPAFASQLPEADHNEIVGWGGGPTVPFALVEIHDPDDPPRTRLRFEARRTVLGGALPLVAAHRLEGDTPLRRLAAGVLWVDLVSVHLALAIGTDPTPVTRIAALKRRLGDDS